MMALYRIVELSEGRLLIDGVDTASIGLRDLRSRLSLVPQMCVQCHLLGAVACSVVVQSLW